jgi:hypothetical protein
VRLAEHLDGNRLIINHELHSCDDVHPNESHFAWVGNQFRDRHLRELLKQAREAAGNENWKAVQNLTNKTILPFDLT